MEETKLNIIEEEKVETQKADNSDLYESTRLSEGGEKDKALIDWNEIKAEYFAGAGPKFLSEKYSMPVETIRSQIKRNGWGKEKRDIDNHLGMLVRDKYAETLAELQIIIREKYRKVFSLLLEPTLEMFRTSNNAKEMFYLSRIIESCMRHEFRCAGITEESDKLLHELINPVPKETTSSGDFIDNLSAVEAHKMWRVLQKMKRFADNDPDKGST